MNALYRLIEENRYRQLLETADRQDEEQAVCLALAYALLQKTDLARQAMQIIRFDQLTPAGQAVHCETEALLAYFSRDFAAAGEKAQQALTLDPAVLIARSVLGRTAEFRRDYPAALAFYKANLEIEPLYEPSRYNCARVQLLQRKPGEAVECMKPLKPSIRKATYVLVCTMTRPGLTSFLICLALTILFSSPVGPYIYFPLAALLLIAIAFSLFRYKDRFASVMAIGVEIITTLLYLLMRWFVRV